jgi:hypothetical protein
VENNYAEWCDVISAAKRAGLGDEFLRELRWTTLAPSELHDFRQLLSKLRGVLKCAEKAWPGVMNDLGISTWPAKLKKLDRQAKHLTFPHVPLEQRHIATAGDKDAYTGANTFTMVVDRNGNGRDTIIQIHTKWPDDAPRRSPMLLDRNRDEDVWLGDPAALGAMVLEFVRMTNGLSPRSLVEPVFKKPAEFYAQRVTDLMECLDPSPSK